MDWLVPGQTQPDISILIVSRPGWSTGIKGCLTSLLQKTHDVSRIEVVLKIDHDASEQTFEVAHSFLNQLPLKIIILDGLLRRNAVPEYSNTLAWNSSGKLLWWWSDEVRMLTQNWDIKMQPYVQQWTDTYTVFFDKNRRGFYPGVSRKMVAAIGRFTYHLCLDSFLDIVSGKLRQIQLQGLSAQQINATVMNLERVQSVELGTQESKDALPTELEPLTTTKLDKDNRQFLVKNGQLKDLNEPEVRKAFHSCGDFLINKWRQDQ